ncbi:MAG TPA: hypothetical protein VL993_00030 [Stellaceae bacterium]|nr:hypothetical protein [Stellaceae bacterium]
MSDKSAEALSLDSGLLNKILELPDNKFVAALDVLAPIADRPEVTQLFETIRPRLRQLQPRRRPTLKRLLFQPVEDLFVAELFRTGSPAIPRTTIAPCWTLLEERLPEELTQLAAELAETPATGDPRSRIPIAKQLWRMGADAIITAGKESRLPEAVAMIGTVLAAASEVESFKQALPRKPLGNLADNPAVVTEVKASVEGLRARGQSVEGYILAIASRLESPAELFQMMQRAEIPLPAAAAKLLGAYVIDEVTKRADELKEVRTIAPEDAARDADRLFRVLSDAQNNLKGSMKAELDSGTRHVAEVIKTVLDRHVIDPAAAAIEAALPAAGAAMEQSQLEAAEAHARALAKTRRLAKHVGLEARANTTVAAIQDRLRQSIEKALDGDPAAAYATIHILEVVAGQSEAERFLRLVQKRRAAAA